MVPEWELHFATHALGIEYSFLPPPSKVPGKLSNSLITAVGRLGQCKKFLGFEIKICWCAYEIFTLMTATTHLPLLTQRWKLTEEMLSGNLTSWSEGGLVNLPITHYSHITYTWQLQRAMQRRQREALFHGHFQNEMKICPIEHTVPRVCWDGTTEPTVYVSDWITRQLWQEGKKEKIPLDS